MGTSLDFGPISLEIVEVYLMEFIEMGLQLLLFLLGEEEGEYGSDFSQFLLERDPLVGELA
jgi:hypothetical protein